MSTLKRWHIVQGAGSLVIDDETNSTVLENWGLSREALQEVVNDHNARVDKANGNRHPDACRHGFYHERDSCRMCEAEGYDE